MNDPPRRGPTKRHLEQLITNTSRAEGTTAARMRRWVSAMVLLGALQRDQYPRPAFILKGGVAVELRLQAAARATQDVDVIFAGDLQRLLDSLDGALAQPYRDFSFRRGEMAPHGPHATRCEVRLSYQSRPWATVRLEISASEESAVEVERIEAIGLESFKLAGPAEIACLSLNHQIAQKLHALTERPIDRENMRFRDLVDLLVLRDLVEDLPSLRQACEATFRHRATHAWPPELSIPDSWRVGYTALATEVGLDNSDIDTAAVTVQRFIAEIAQAQPKLV